MRSWSRERTSQRTEAAVLHVRKPGDSDTVDPEIFSELHEPTYTDTDAAI